MPKPPLTIELLANEAKRFGQAHRELKVPELYGATDGKAVGTYIEKRFHDFLSENMITSLGRRLAEKTCPR